jgi:hypothetical protein
MTAQWRGLAGAATIAAVIAAAVGCDDGHGAWATVDSPEARRLDGSWAIELRVDRLGFEPVNQRARGVRVVRGEVALVANHWLSGGSDLPRPTHYGTYDIDFRMLGFDPRHGGELPRVAARARGRDSVDIALEPDDPHESVQLRGAWRGDSIVGAWSLEPVRAGGDAAGVFTMARRVAY